MSSISPTSTSTTSGTATATSGGSSGSAGQAVISSSGLGSGVDINSIVTALVNAEGQGQTAQIKSQQTQIQAQVSAYGQLNTAAQAVQTAIDTLTSAATFNNYTGTVADTTVASATVSASAVPGTYSLSVSQLAQGSILSSAAFTSASATVGTGTLTISAGSNSFSVKIGSSNNTLSGIAAAINGASGNPGVEASIITGNDGAHLVLSSQVTGASSAVSVTQSTGDTLNKLVYTAGGTSNGLTQTQAAQDAILSVNGYTYNSSTNAVTGALSGVTINLAAASKAGATTTLTVASDPSGPTSAIQTFVTSYNALIGVIGQLDTYDSASGAASALFGDSTLEGFGSQLSQIVAGGVPNASNSSAALTSLAQIGITVNLDGTLAVDSGTLSTALKNNPTGVTTLFTSASSGVATKLSNLLFEYTSAGGIVDQAVQALNGTLTDLQTQQTDLNTRLADLQATLYATYNNMDTVVANLKATGNSITAQLAALPTYYGPSTSTSSGN